jgi:hypothetical protein
MSAKVVRGDLLNDADFILHDHFSPWNGKPVNLTGLVSGGYDFAKVRYGRDNRRVLGVDLRELNTLQNSAALTR